MESFYLIVVVCLVLLAISDLVVGVANDAVNFLNSALGSKAATRKTILIVATAGIALGALSSSGMMEIARKGIFNPEMFTFADIMIIFLAVMITDILLLDLFNTLGMPTSTTVSIMFELLGAAFAMACLKIFLTGDSFATIGNYLNSEKATLIISGIFLSVLIAFTFGVLVQYIVRLLFSFNLDKTLKTYGPVFGGIAITTITYFLLIKGFKHASFVPEAAQEWINNNTVLLLGINLVFWTLCCYLLNKLLKVNILKVVVLSGTFSLAMAFAGNDLVNFIGVPIAGFQAYTIFKGQSAGAEDLNMGVLGEEIQTSGWILIAAGLIMVLTLWFSKKARSVTETEINLARESAGSERFKSNIFSRLIVRGGIGLGKVSNRVMSDNLKYKIDQRFEKNAAKEKEVREQPAFDMVRASVNLMMASVIIAAATSYKLPLSTTFVSFMVAMGTSLADRAWNRESAVYRVSGVVNVISGWLITAVIAFTAAAVLAIVLYYGGIYAVIGLMAITVFVLIRSNVLHKKIEAKSKSSLEKTLSRDNIRSEEVFKESEQRISTTLFTVSHVLQDVIRGLKNEEKSIIIKAKKEVEKYQKEYKDLSASFYFYLQKIESNSTEEGRFYLHVLNYLQNISQSIDLISQQVFTHVNNFHKQLEGERVNDLTVLVERMGKLFEEIADLMGVDKKGSLDEIEAKSNALLLLIDELEDRHLRSVREEKSSPKNSMLYISILLECRDILNDFSGLVALYEEEDIPPVAPDILKVLE